MPIIHGIKVNEINSGARAIAAVSTAVIGLVALSTDADAVAFPAGKPVLVTDVAGALAKAGTDASDGTLANALDAIADQSSPIVVVTRVEPGEDEEATEAAVQAGVQTLRMAESTLGVRPRILGAPGLDTAPVINDLITVAQKLRGFAYCAAAGATAAEAITAADDFSARELMLLWPEFSDFTGSAAARARPAGADRQRNGLAQDPLQRGH